MCFQILGKLTFFFYIFFLRKRFGIMPNSVSNSTVTMTILPSFDDILISKTSIVPCPILGELDAPVGKIVIMVHWVS